MPHSINYDFTANSVYPKALWGVPPADCHNCRRFTCLCCFHVSSGSRCSKSTNIKQYFLLSKRQQTVAGLHVCTFHSAGVFRQSGTVCCSSIAWDSPVQSAANLFETYLQCLKYLTWCRYKRLCDCLRRAATVRCWLGTEEALRTRRQWVCPFQKHRQWLKVWMYFPRESMSFKTGITLPGRSDVSLAATGPCRLQLR